jgi:hypothetical protein
MNATDNMLDKTAAAYAASRLNLPKGSVLKILEDFGIACIDAGHAAGIPNFTLRVESGLGSAKRLFIADEGRWVEFVVKGDAPANQEPESLIESLDEDHVDCCGHCQDEFNAEHSNSFWTPEGIDRSSGLSFNEALGAMRDGAIVFRLASPTLLLAFVNGSLAVRDTSVPDAGLGTVQFEQEDFSADDWAVL